MKPKVFYNNKVKILSIRLKPGRSIDSDIRNNVVFDYDKKGNIVNIDVMMFNLEALARKTGAKKMHK